MIIFRWQYLIAVATLALMASACLGQAADEEKDSALDLRSLVYKDCAPWAIHGDPKKGRLVYWEKVHGKPVVDFKLLDVRSLFEKDKLYRVRVMNERFVQWNGPPHAYKGLIVRDGKAEILHTEKDILRALKDAKLKEVEDVALLCRLFAEMSGMSLAGRPPAGKESRSMVSEDVLDQSKTDWSITIRKLNNQWRASFTVIDVQSHRVVRYGLLFGLHGISVTKKKVISNGMTFL